MSQKTLATALALLTAQAGLPSSAAAQDSFRWEQQCQEWRRIDDTAELQAQLEFLLLNRPDDPCIEYLVSRLGGAPTASVTPTGGGDGTGEDPTPTVGPTVLSY